MSSLKDSDKLCAKLSVKVPQPDSLVEVRVTPPDSNFEVKVLPGEEVIELTIRPLGSLIEVRIGPAGLESAAAKTGNLAEEAGVSDQADDDDEDEVVKGVSRAEFEALIEEEQGAEARKFLDHMVEIEEISHEEHEEHEAATARVVTARPAEVPPELDPADPAFRLPEETLKLLVDEGEEKIDPALAEAMADPGLHPAFRLPEATLKRLVDEGEEKTSPDLTEALEAREDAEAEAPKAVETEVPEAGEAPESAGAAEAPEEVCAEDEDKVSDEAETPEAVETEAPEVGEAPEGAGAAEAPEEVCEEDEDKVSDEAETPEAAETEVPEAAEAPESADADEAPEGVCEEDEDKVSDEAETPEAAETEAPEASEALEGAGAPEDVYEEDEDFDKVSDETETPPEEDDEPVGGSAGPVARAALARLSAAFGEERALAEMAEASAPEPADEPAPAATLTTPARPDSTVVVELYKDAETAEPAPLTSPPLTEEEELDLSPVERQDEELSIGPIDVKGLEGVDLDKSRHSGTVIKAKPLVKATPSGTIVPVS